MSKRQMILDSLIKKENSRMDDDILAGNIVDEVVDSNKISLKMISIMERDASEVFLNYLNRETIGRTRRDIFRTHPNLKPSPDKDQRKKPKPANPNKEVPKFISYQDDSKLVKFQETLPCFGEKVFKNDTFNETSDEMINTILTTKFNDKK